LPLSLAEKLWRLKNDPAWTTILFPVEVLSFKVPEAGRAGPIAWQMHNKGPFDEYKDVRIEVDPKTNGFITTR
jgi:hypothetical protein